MPDAFLRAGEVWPIITHLGSAGVAMPTLAIVAAGLWCSRQQGAVRVWLLALTIAVAITLASKIMFMGWGIGIAAIDFTGFSGHVLLATSVMPVLFSWLAATHGARFHLAAASFGLLLGIGVAISRVVLGMHSVSEVVLAWIIGSAVSAAALAAMRSPAQRPWFARLSPLVLLLAFGTGTSNYLPTHDWETRIALRLSGHDEPYTRHHLTRTGGAERVPQPDRS